MNDIYKDIVIDGELDSGSFRGIGLAIDKNMLRRLLTYKEKFPDVYEKINNLLFRKKCGMAFSHLKFETDHEKALDYAADIMQINPEITTESTDSRCEKFSCIYPEYSAQADGSGLLGDGSVTDIVQKIIGSRYSILYFSGRSALNTQDVWSGNFEVSPLLWSMAHVTYFGENGWKYSDCNSDKDYMSLSSESGDYSIIFVNNSSQPRKYSVCIKSISKSGDAVHCVETKGPENSGSFCANWFRVVDKILPCRKDYGYCYNVEVKPFSVLTCTTAAIDEINGIDTFEYSMGDKSTAELPYILESQNAVLPLWDISGNFEEYCENEKTFIEQTEVYDDISDKKTACTIFGDKLLCNYHLTAFTEFADDNKDNFVGIGICCGENGEMGYALRIYPDGCYEILDSHNVSEIQSTYRISVLSPNCLEIIIDEKTIVYKLNGEILCSNAVEGTPRVFSGYGALLSAYKRNTFSGVKIEQNEKNVPFCHSYDCLCGEFEYSDGWIKNGNADEEFTHRTSVGTDTENQTFEFEFIGEKAALFGKTKDLRIKIEIDGAIVKAGSTAKRNCSINEAFYIAENLENNIHTLKLTILSGKLEFDSAQIYYSDRSLVQQAAAEKIRKHKQKNKPLKKSTILLGAGLAAAGAGAFLLRKMFKDKKK